MLDTFGWVVFLIPLAVGVVGARDYRLAKVLICASAIAIGARLFFWVYFELKAAPWQLGLIYLAILASIIVGLWIGFRWVDQRREQIEPRAQKGANVAPQPRKAQPRQTQPKQAQAKQESRDIIDVSPERLCSFYREHMSSEADRLFEVYKGKWLRFSGKVRDVVHYVSGNSTVSFERGFTGGIPDPTVATYFNPDWKDRLGLLHRGQDITILGRIESADTTMLFIWDCEIVDSVQSA